MLYGNTGMYHFNGVGGVFILLGAVADPGFLQWGAAAGAFGVPQAPSCPLSLRPLRNLVGASCKVKIGNSNNRAVCSPHYFQNW